MVLCKLWPTTKIVILFWMHKVPAVFKVCSWSLARNYLGIMLRSNPKRVERRKISWNISEWCMLLSFIELNASELSSGLDYQQSMNILVIYYNSSCRISELILQHLNEHYCLLQKKNPSICRGYFHVLIIFLIASVWTAWTIKNRPSPLSVCSLKAWLLIFM